MCRREVRNEGDSVPQDGHREEERKEKKKTNPPSSSQSETVGPT